MATTTRWGLPYPVGADAADVPEWMRDLALSLDGVAMDDQGILANRPVSTAGTPGKRGRYYMVAGDPAPANNGKLWRDNGTGWDQVGSANTLFDTTANRPAATAVPTGTRFFSTDQIAEWVTDGTNWHRVGTQAGDITLTAEASARSGYVLLQGQAWPSTTGIYADLHTLWGGATLPDMRDRAVVAAGVNLATLTNDGVASANRHGLRHKHAAHSHSTSFTSVYGGSGNTGFAIADGYLMEYADPGGIAPPAGRETVVKGSSSVDGGSGVSTDPQDGGAFLVLQPQAKL